VTVFFATLAFFLTAMGLWAGRIVALKYGYADKPGGRKKHDNPIPPIGGLLIVPVFLIASYFSGVQDIVPWPLCVGLLSLMAMGAVDDVYPLKPFLKFTIMLWIACFVVIFGEMQIAQLGNLFGFGLVEVGFISKAFTVMCLVLLMNAINMMDGVDGLAGGFCALVILWMAAACAGSGDFDTLKPLAILLSCLAGFLIWNMRFPWISSAKIFLGDSGALCLGLLIGWFAIKTTQASGAPLNPVTVIWFIALPVMDAFALYIARSYRGLHPFNADRRHLHHRILDAGISQSKTTLILLFIVSLMAVFGLAAQANNIPDYVLFYLWLVLFAFHTIGIMHPRGYLHFVRYLKSRLR
jgi:UDP-GlcNAc:undecaprenyl-phosphate/decaprenyl-phosphate GlcNAc-1-phosphate transferase